MSTDLQEIMHEHARQAQASRIDVAAVVRAGDRRRRHRSYLGAAVASATVVGIGVTVVPLLGDDSPGTIAPAGAFTQREASYATGSTIHYGDESLDVSPHVPRAYVQTDDGFVFAEADGVVRLATETGVEEIGTGVADGRYLKADDTGSHVAWIDSDGQLPELVVYDTAMSQEVLRTAEGFRAGMATLRDDDPAFVFAVDDGAAYVRDAEGLARFDVSTGARTLLAAGVEGFDVADVAAGLIAHELPRLGRGDFGGQAVNENGDIPLTMVLSTDYSPDGTPLPQSSNQLSPDARYVVTDYSDSERIFNVTTGAEVTPQLPAYGFIAVTNWTSEESAYVVGLARGRVDLLECDLASGTCSVEAEDIGRDFQVPIGELI